MVFANKQEISKKLALSFLIQTKVGGGGGK